MIDVRSFLDYLAADKGCPQTTVRTYRESLENLERYFRLLDDRLAWDNLDADVVRRWMAERMKSGRSPRTVKRDMSAVRSFYRYLLRMQLVEKDPTQSIGNPKAAKPLPTFLKEQEINRLFDEIIYPEGFEGLRDRTILLTFCHTGIRRAELLGLTPDKVHLATGELKVLGKRSKERIVPFGGELQQALAEYMAARRDIMGGDGGPLFVNENGRPVNEAKVAAIVRKYLSMVTIRKKKSPHVLRHTFATLMLNHGADLEAVKELLGHESLATTEIYTHTTFATLKKEYEHAHPRA